MLRSSSSTRTPIVVCFFPSVILASDASFSSCGRDDNKASIASEMNQEILKKYQIAREDSGQLIDRIYSLAQLVAAAARSPDAQSEVSVEALGVANEVISEDIKQVESIFDAYLDELRRAGRK